MHRNINSLAIVAIVLIIAFIGVVFVLLPNLPKSLTTVRIGDGVFKTRVALSQSEREKGLSGEPYLNASEGLLMVFPESGKWGIWMKGMKVPLDLVWLDSNKKVVYIVKDAQPVEEIDLKTYIPRASAKYVLELPAGSVDAKSIKSDSVAIFDVNEEDVK